MNVIVDSVNALRELQQLTYAEFEREHVLHGSAERDFQVAIQAALDVGAYLLAEAGVPPPAEYQQVFREMGRVGIVPPVFANKLTGMAKFRNVLVHLYLEVDLKKVFAYLQNDLGDFELYAQYVSEYLTQREAEDNA